MQELLSNQLALAENDTQERFESKQFCLILDYFFTISEINGTVELCMAKATEASKAAEAAQIEQVQKRLPFRQNSDKFSG